MKYKIVLRNPKNGKPVKFDIEATSEGELCETLELFRFNGYVDGMAECDSGKAEEPDKPEYKILHAVLFFRTLDGEYEWSACSEARDGKSWNGDVRGYVRSLEGIGGDFQILSSYPTIRDRPDGAVVVGFQGYPVEIYWVEDMP